MRIAGASITLAPAISSSVRSCDACSRARVTTIVRPNSGRRSNQLILLAQPHDIADDRNRWRDHLLARGRFRERRKRGGDGALARIRAPLDESPPACSASGHRQ